MSFTGRFVAVLQLTTNEWNSSEKATEGKGEIRYRQMYGACTLSRICSRAADDLVHAHNGACNPCGTLAAILMTRSCIIEDLIIRPYNGW